MKLFRKLYLSICKVPFETDKQESSDKFIISKHDKVNDENSCKISKEIEDNLKYIKVYGNILEPVKVSACDFSSKWIIRENVAGYYALKASKFQFIPIQIIK